MVAWRVPTLPIRNGLNKTMSKQVYPVYSNTHRSKCFGLLQLKLGARQIVTGELLITVTNILIRCHCHSFSLNIFSWSIWRYTKMAITVDTHAPSQFRVIGSVKNNIQFSKDFGCASGTPMNPVQKCEIWWFLGLNTNVLCMSLNVIFILKMCQKFRTV